MINKLMCITVIKYLNLIDVLSLYFIYYHTHHFYFECQSIDKILIDRTGYLIVKVT